MAKEYGCHYEGSANFDNKYILMYWRARSNSGNGFDIQTYDDLSSWGAGDGKKGGLLAPMVGKLAYGIWKALHSRESKKEQNLKSFEENGSPYEEGKKIESLDLIVKNVATSEFSYSRWAPAQTSHLLICEDPKTGFKVKVKLGKDEISSNLYSLFFDTQDNRNKAYNYSEAANSLPEFEKMKNINISGKVSKINPEYKSISLSYVKINSPTLEEINSFRNLMYAKNEELKNKSKEVKNNQTINSMSKDQFSRAKHVFISALQDFINKNDLKSIKSLLNIVKDEYFDVLTDDEKELINKAKNLVK